MLKRVFFSVMLCCVAQVFSQVTKTCDTPESEPALDLNSITKCSIEESDDKSKGKKTKKVSVEVISRRRVIRKRDAATGVMANDYTHKLSEIKKKTEVVKSLNLDKTGGLRIIPFDYVEEIPLFKACERVSILKQSKCFKKELSNHIRRNLKYPEDAYEKAIQGRVFVRFVIDNNGNIGKMKITSPYKGEMLGEEAKRIVKELPKFKPGKHEGGAVSVKYGLPIAFKIPGIKPSNVKKKVEKIEKSEVYGFGQVEKIPQFNSCNESGDISINCFNQNLIDHIKDNFAYPTDAIKANIQGKIHVNFIINKEGEVMNVVTKGPDNGKILEIAAKKLVEKLPKFNPAFKDGKAVNVKYTFPVIFKLD